MISLAFPAVSPLNHANQKKKKKIESQLPAFWCLCTAGPVQFCIFCMTSSPALAWVGKVKVLLCHLAFLPTDAGLFFAQSFLHIFISGS